MGKSQSPHKRSESPKGNRKPTSDDILLESRMKSQIVEPPTSQFYALGFVISLLPTYLAIFLYEVQVTITNLVLFALVCGSVCHMLAQAYSILFTCEFMKRDNAFSEVKSQKDANLLRSLRLELSMGRSVFICNAIFLALTSSMQMYMFKNEDPRLGYFVSPLIAGIISWFVAYKNEDSRKKALEGPVRH